MPLPARPQTTRRNTLGDESYQAILGLILDGTLQPGEILRDKELAAWLGMSRTPVREALNRLSAVHLVEMVPNKYTRVAELDETRMIEVANAIYALYEQVIEDAVPELTDADRVELTALADRLLAGAEVVDRTTLTEASFGYFLVLARVGGNQTLLHLIEQLGPQAYRALSPRETLTPIEGIVARLRQVHDCVLSGDTTAAVRALRDMTAPSRAVHAQRVFGSTK